MLFELLTLTSESEISPVSGSVCFCVNFASMVIFDGAQGESSRILLVSAAVHWSAGLSPGVLAVNENPSKPPTRHHGLLAPRGISLSAAVSNHLRMVHSPCCVLSVPNS